MWILNEINLKTDMKNKLLLVAGLTGCALAWAAKDPVIMTINGEDVTKSEFEYLYHKNSQQQIGQQTLDEYAEMFKIYKLKVADALAEGLDTTKQFKSEFNGYRDELAAPYLVDSTYVKKLMKEAYDRTAEEVEVSHIMFFTNPRDAKLNYELSLRADSIRMELLNGANFEELAKKHSQDQSAKTNGGNLGYITSLIYPYSFETAAYNLKEGEISDVVRTPVGYHVLKGGARRPARGKVLVEHILKLVPKTATEADAAKIKAEIDSIYEVVKAGADFSKVAMTESDDKNSARQGGKLPWFGTGQMVKEFDSAAFALNVGEISEPIRTSYGWHIIKKLDAKQRDSYAELEPQIKARLNDNRDLRYKMIREQKGALLAKEYKAKENDKILKEMRAYISANGVDSVFHTKYDNLDEVIFSYADVKMPVSEPMSKILRYKNSNPDIALEYFNGFLANYENVALMNYEKTQLARKYPEYKNLINEYRDGMLLFEVSNRKVWDKASRDTEGLNKFFEEHREDYKWTEPHVKGYLIQAKNDSIAKVIETRMNELGRDTMLNTVRKEFGKVSKIDKVLVTKGENAMVDNIVFGASPVTPSNSQYEAYFLYDFVVINEPQDVDDVRGQVTGDYQNLLEQEWIEELKVKYPVVVNQKELKKVK